MASTPIGYERRFQIGRVISNAVDVVVRNFLLCAGLSLLFVGLPQMLFRWLILAPMMLTGNRIAPGMMGAYFGYAGLLGLVNLALGVVLSAALVRAAIEHLSGRTPRIGECLMTALRLALPLIVMFILIGIAVTIGLMLLIVPGVILMLGWALVVPVMVQERRGIIESMSRSRELARGTKWSLFGLYLVVLVAAWMLQSMVMMAQMTSGPLVTAVAAGLVAAFVALVYACIPAAAYVELRAVKEGASVQELAEVFA